jgi:glycosyltransferase involved in cell wall biosynthesis
LPVYVADRYDGIEARPFPELDDAELERYIERNVAAVREVAERVKPDVALANHLVMGPLILARALADLGVPYAVKIHGSALEYTVKPYPRFMPHAREGLAAARGILVGSRHTAESLWAAMDDDSVRARTRLGPPGVDVERFAPREPDAAAAGLAALRERLAALGGERPPPGEAAPPEVSSFARDPAEAARALATIDPADRVVVFVGKLIGSKGAELLLAAWPLVLARAPDARLIVVGFGAFRAGLERLAAALADGDLDAARATRNEHGAELPLLEAFLASLEGEEAATYRRAAGGLRERVAWAGRFEHEELADLLPASAAMAVPSTFPEAFGMVAAEAAACGALPVVAGHSGLAEVARSLAAEVPAPARDWLAFELGPGAVRELADHLAAWLSAPGELRAGARAALVRVAHGRYGWGGVADTILAAAQGRLDELPAP